MCSERTFRLLLLSPDYSPGISRNSGNARWHTVVSRCGTTTAVRTEPQPPSVNAQRRNTKGSVTWFTLLRAMFYPEIHLVFISNKEDISRKSFANSYPWTLAQQWCLLITRLSDGNLRKAIRNQRWLCDPSRACRVKAKASKILHHCPIDYGLVPQFGP
jgi:hypothetical protein